MTDDYMNLKRYLLNSDPVAREPEMSAFDAQVMRQRVLREAASQPASAPALWWLRPIAVAGALAACLVAGVGIGLRINEREPLSPAPAVARPAPPRQMQFAAPGGTRIIWTFHQEFDL